MCGPCPLTHHSYANLEEVTFTHLHWVLAIDFAAQQLRGSAEYTLTTAAANAADGDADADADGSVVVLDTSHLTIHKVFVDGIESSSFQLLAADAVFGAPLQIPITASTTRIKIDYATTTQATGLQWLAKELTADKTHPYLFTQCQAIHARSIVPCPDTPGCKFSYSAEVTAPVWCTPLLSAVSVPTSEHEDDQDEERQASSAVAANAHAHANASDVATATHCVHFRQEVPIPSYLLAIAAGRIESVAIGPRSRVWAEPSVVHRAAYEFAQTEAFLQHGEAITGQDYVWKRYDLVCLPPSFPYGGMENPCLTFVTPTLLAGDRSLADVVAHEIAHSWTGNLVTNRTWTDFWLNEGWTRWLETKIVARVHEDDRVVDLKAAMGLRALKESVHGFGATHPYTQLVPDSEGVDPDDVFSSIPYEKGLTFLHYLTEVVGGRTVFDTFAKAYIHEFRFKTLTSREFQTFFTTYFTETLDRRAAIAVVEWDKWFYAPGMPVVMPQYDTTLTTEAIVLGESMAASSEPSTWGPASSESVTKWQTAQWVLLLDTMLMAQAEKNVAFTAPHLDAIDAFVNHQLTTSGNAELRFRWYTLSLRAGDPRQNDNIAAFLGEQGRMKYVRPLFRDLIKYAGKPHAEALFATTKALYHPICAKMVQRSFDEA